MHTDSSVEQSKIDKDHSRILIVHIHQLFALNLSLSISKYNYKFECTNRKSSTITPIRYLNMLRSPLKFMFGPKSILQKCIPNLQTLSLHLPLSRSASIIMASLSKLKCLQMFPISIFPTSSINKSIPTY